MTIEHEEFLLKTYPSLFPEKRIREDITQSDLARGFECGDGWFSLLNELFEKMVATGYDVKLTQVKERLGTLRIYVDPYCKEIEDLLTEAEHKSARVCEICGKKGKLYTDGWCMVRCDKCKE